MDAIGRVARAAGRLGISSAGGECGSTEERPSITPGESGTGTGTATMAWSGSRTRRVAK